MVNSDKLTFEGIVVGIQPRIRLTRSFDQRDHSYLGFALLLTGELGGVAQECTIGIGKEAQAKHGIQAGDRVAGESLPVADPNLESVGFYKVSALEVVKGKHDTHIPPPWLGIPPKLEVYCERGHRRLSIRSYENQCKRCIWGCLMPVTMIIDHWNSQNRKYRTESFCYGPKSCTLYHPGPKRFVPGRKGMSWTEEDWVEEAATRHRELDA